MRRKQFVIFIVGTVATVATNISKSFGHNKDFDCPYLFHILFVLTQWEWKESSTPRC